MIPDEQAAEYNRLIRLMNGAYELGLVLMGLEGVLALAGAQTLVVHDAPPRVEDDMRTISAWQLFETAEPITETAFRARLAEGREDLLSLNEAAELLVAEEGAPEDDASYARAVKEKRRLLTAAITTGELSARGTGSRSRIPPADSTTGRGWSSTP